MHPELQIRDYTPRWRSKLGFFNSLKTIIFGKQLRLSAKKEFDLLNLAEQHFSYVIIFFIKICISLKFFRKNTKIGSEAYAIVLGPHKVTTWTTHNNLLRHFWASRDYHWHFHWQLYIEFYRSLLSTCIIHGDHFKHAFIRTS